MIGKDLGDFCMGKGKITKKNFITKVVHGMYVADRSIGIEAMREGITLGGYADLPAISRSMSEKVISTLMFADARVKIDDVLGALVPCYMCDEMGKEIKNPTNEERRLIEIQTKFYKTIFKSFLKDKAEKNKKFLAKFLSYVTGMSYVPHFLAKPKYDIRIEFHKGLPGEERLPSVKTCDNALLLPFHAYDCNRQLFEKLLKESMRICRKMNFNDM